MKKYVVLFLLVIIIIAVITYISFFNKKEEETLKVHSHLIDATLEIAGGMRVRELIVVEGTTKQFSRTINYRNITEDWDKETINFNNGSIYNGGGIFNVKVSAFPIDETVDFNSFPENIEYFEALDISNPTANYYTSITNELGAKYNIFKPIENERIAFYIEYLIGNVTVIHEDIAEVNYNFKNLAIGAQSTNIRVILPMETDDEKTHLWVHGPAKTVLNEFVDKDINMGFLAQIPNMNSELRFRIAMPKENIMIQDFLNHSNVNALEEIQKIENEFVVNQEKAQKVSDIFKYGLMVLSSIYVLASLIIFKFKEKNIFILYLILGLLLLTFNFLFNFNIIWIYFIIAAPLITKLITKFKKV